MLESEKKVYTISELQTIFPVVEMLFDLSLYILELNDGSFEVYIPVLDISGSFEIWLPVLAFTG